MDNGSSSSGGVHPLALVAVSTGCLTVVLASALAYAVLHRSSSGSSSSKSKALESPSSSRTTDQQQQTQSSPQNNIDRHQFPGGHLYVYFCTQTGTAESFARQLEREGSAEHGFCVHCVDIEDVANDDSDNDIDGNSKQCQLQSPCVILSATYGEGEPPDHANQFVHALKRRAGLDDLLQPNGPTDPASNSSTTTADRAFCDGLEYAVFGLGNKQYDHYNAVGKFLDVALERAGGRRLLPLGLGDDDDDLESDFEAWKDSQLWPRLKEKYRVAAAAGDGAGGESQQNGQQQSKLKNELPDCPLQVVYHNDDAAAATNQQPVYDLPSEQIHSSSRHYFTAVDCPVTAVRELLTDTSDGASTVHVEIDIGRAKSLSPGRDDNGNNRNSSNSSNRLLTYTTADNLGVLPVNDARLVEQVAAALQYDLDAVFSVQAAGTHEWHGAPFPAPCTVRECLTRYCDLTAPPRRSDLKLLANYCHDAVDQKALRRLASKEGRAEYKTKILERYVGLAQLLQLCPSIAMPLEHFLHVCAPLQARFFTISSSSSVHPRSVHLTVAVTRHRRPRDNRLLFEGVCSGHLAKCGSATAGSANSTSEPATVRVFHRPSTFRLPSDPSKPILMLGPGTGIAPMRALLQERQYQKQTLRQAVGPTVLHFGCRKRSQDYLYEEELEAFAKDGTLDHLRVAFSREQSHKVYVQHLLKQNAPETWQLIHDDGAHVYVCGAVLMGHDVSEALKEIIASQGNMSPDDAKQYLAKLSHDGRFVQELWA